MKPKLYSMSKDEKALIIPGPEGDIEAVVSSESETEIIGIICHPHPEGGGSMNNKVVTSIQKTFSKLGLKTIRFNFRGVGNSAGEFGEGKGEQEDLHAVISWAKEKYPDNKLWLAGFSFGAYVSMCATASWPVEQLVSVAPPVTYGSLKKLKRPDCPWVIIQGTEDEIFDSDAVLKWAASLEPPPEVIVIPGASHFFHGRLLDLQTELSNALSPRLEK